MAKSLYNNIFSLLAILAGGGLWACNRIDTSVTTTTQVIGALSSSYTANANWQGQDFQHYAFAGNVIARHQKSGLRWNHQHALMADLSYLKFIDSLWIKHTDRLLLNLLWSEEGARFRHSYAVNISSQFLPSYQYSYDFEKGRVMRERTAWGLCPTTVEAGYGMTRQFWEISSINLAFATIRMSALPRNDSFEAVADEQLAQGKKAYYTLEYGLMFTANIHRKLGDRVTWMNTSRFFCNAFNRDQVSLDIQNRITFQLWKFLQLRFDTKLAYNPLINYHFQFSQEVMLGAGFELLR